MICTRIDRRGDKRERCTLKLQHIISYSTLAISIVTLVLVLRRPAPVATPVAPAAAAASAESFQKKIEQLEQARAANESAGNEGAGSQGAGEVRINSDELNAALAEAAGAIPAAAAAGSMPSNTGAASSSASASSSNTAPNGASNGNMEFPGPVPSVKDYQVSMDGDTVRGQFLTQIAGKDVYLTLAGHLSAKDGYATFDATEVKIGDLSVPASLVNEVLQKKLSEQRDQLKLPANVKDIKVENGELVLVEK